MMLDIRTSNYRAFSEFFPATCLAVAAAAFAYNPEPLQAHSIRTECKIAAVALAAILLARTCAISSSTPEVARNVCRKIFAYPDLSPLGRHAPAFLKNAEIAKELNKNGLVYDQLMQFLKSGRDVSDQSPVQRIVNLITHPYAISPLNVLKAFLEFPLKDYVYGPAATAQFALAFSSLSIRKYNTYDQSLQSWFFSDLLPEMVEQGVSSKEGIAILEGLYNAGVRRIAACKEFCSHPNLSAKDWEKVVLNLPGPLHFLINEKDVPVIIRLSNSAEDFSANLQSYKNLMERNVASSLEPFRSNRIEKLLTSLQKQYEVSYPDGETEKLTVEQIAICPPETFSHIFPLRTYASISRGHKPYDLQEFYKGIDLQILNLPNDLFAGVLGADALRKRISSAHQNILSLTNPEKINTEESTLLRNIATMAKDRLNAYVALCET